ncbi:YceD family protein [Hydrogenophaga soli]|nr:DUF177 domain-containing protein [Burkholderiaceae bacterium]
MSLTTLPAHFSVSAFASGAQTLSGVWPRDAIAGRPVPFERLGAEACEDGGVSEVCWLIRGELRQGPGGVLQPWLHLEVSARLPLVCQRCLAPVVTRVTSERSFRFVADEVTAAAEDDASEEDVLVLDVRFDWPQLVEDELIMSLPLVPMHDQCPQPVLRLHPSDSLSAVEEGSGDRVRPFAGLREKMGRSGD